MSNRLPEETVTGHIWFTVMEQPLLTPTARVLINGVEPDAVPARHACYKSIVTPSGSCELTLASHGEAITAAIGDTFELHLGYRGFGDWRVFTGWVQRVEPASRSRHVVRLTAWDDRPLRIMRASHAPVQTSPQDYVTELLAEAGIEKFEVELPTNALSHTVRKNQSVLESLRTIRRRAKIPYGWYFDADGKFHWHPWRFEQDRSDLPRFEQLKNIVQLKPEARDLSLEEKSPDPTIPEDLLQDGPIFALKAVPQPWVQAGWVVIVQDDRTDGVELFRTEEITHRGGSQMRSTLQIRGVAT